MPHGFAAVAAATFHGTPTSENCDYMTLDVQNEDSITRFATLFFSHEVATTRDERAT